MKKSNRLAFADGEKETVDLLRTAFTWGGPQEDNFVFADWRVTKLEDRGDLLDQRRYMIICLRCVFDKAPEGVHQAEGQFRGRV